MGYWHVGDYHYLQDVLPETVSCRIWGSEPHQIKRHTMYNRLLLLLLVAMLLTGCGLQLPALQFPFYCEDNTASICYLMRRPIFAPREKSTSNPPSQLPRQ